VQPALAYVVLRKRGWRRRRTAPDPPWRRQSLEGRVDRSSTATWTSSASTRQNA